MKFKKSFIISSIVFFAVAVTAFWFLKPAPTVMAGAPPMVAVNMPTLKREQLLGQTAFQDHCAVCHGPNAGGQDGLAPPLIHKIYEPSHHGDMSFYLAARRGVVAHHWRFGNMPPVEGVTDAELLNIVQFIRAVQRANGIS